MQRYLKHTVLLLCFSIFLAQCTILKAFIHQGPREKVAKIENITIPSWNGEILVRVYTPPGSGPFPILVYNHGGGWKRGSVYTHDKLCRFLSNKVGCLVVSVNYRLAPKYKFPIPVEDAYAATLWAFKNAVQINGDPARVAVGGDSAGGNLAAAVCLMAKDRGGPPLVFQLLAFPATNLASLDTESYRTYAKGPGLTKSDVEKARGSYLRGVEDRFNPYASPLLARDLSRLPPALVITGEYDVARDDGEAYAERLKKRGVPARCYRIPGMGHAAPYWALASEVTQKPLYEAVSALHLAFTK